FLTVPPRPHYTLFPYTTALPICQFFALASQHMRWELNDMARRLDERPAAVELNEALVSAPSSSDTGLTPDGRRMLEAIGNLPERDRKSTRLNSSHQIISYAVFCL